MHCRCLRALGILVVCALTGMAQLAGAQDLTPATHGVPLPGQGPRAYVAIVIDDLANLGLWTKLADDSDAFGIKTTLALNTAQATPQDYAALAQRIARGHEVANHTRDHVPVAPGGVLRLRYFDAKATSAAAVIDETGQKLRIVVNGQTPVAEFDLSAKGPTPSLKALVGAINGTPGMAAELADPYDANIQSRFLAARNQVDIFFKNGFVPLFVDVAAHARYEMEGGKSDIQAGLPGYTCDSMVYPFLVTDPISRQITQELKMTSGRVGPAGYAALGAPTGYDLYQIYAIKPRDLFGPDPSRPDFATKVAAFLKKIKEVGGVCCLYSHGPGEFTNEQWKTLLALLSKDKDVAYVTLRELAAYVRHTAQLRGGKYYLPAAK